MQKIYLSLLTLCLAIVNSASAQQFVNGSLEPTVSASSINPCIPVSNLTFNTDMGGTVYSFGTLFQSPNYGLYFNDSSCHDSTAKAGHYSLAMDWSSSGYTAVALKVNPAMQAGHSYNVSLWYSSSLYFSSCNFQVGYSADSSVFGTSIGSVSAPGVYPIPTMWIQRTFNFTPTIACKWITVQTTSSTQNSSTSPYMYTLIDNFSLSSTTSVQQIEENDADILISPNPAKNIAYLSFNNTQFNNNLQLTISDMTGRTIQRNNPQLASGTNSIILNLENMPNGIYLVNITDGRRSATQKLALVR